MGACNFPPSRPLFTFPWHCMAVSERSARVSKVAAHISTSFQTAHDKDPKVLSNKHTSSDRNEWGQRIGGRVTKQGQWHETPSGGVTKHSSKETVTGASRNTTANIKTL